MTSSFHDWIVPHFNAWVYVIIMMTGLWAVIAKNNLIKKLIGLSLFQTSILLLYVSLGVKEGAGIPIIDHEAAALAMSGSDDALNPDRFANPLPHVLMLTAIVVGVATLGVALALCQTIYRDFGTLEEDEVLEQMKTLHDDV